MERTIDRSCTVPETFDKPVESTPCISPSTARPLILTSCLLASKFNYDEGVRMKHVRRDADLLSALGAGLIAKFGTLEEHVLCLLDWQLRVTAADYTAGYTRLVEFIKSEHHCTARAPSRVQSLPANMAELAA